MSRSDFAIGIRYAGPDDNAAPWFRGALDEIRQHRSGSVAIEIEGHSGDREAGSLVAVSGKPKDAESAGVIELDDGRLISCDWIASFRLLPPLPGRAAEATQPRADRAASPSRRVSIAKRNLSATSPATSSEAWPTTQ